MGVAIKPPLDKVLIMGYGQIDLKILASLQIPKDMMNTEVVKSPREDFKKAIGPLMINAICGSMKGKV